MPDSWRMRASKPQDVETELVALDPFPSATGYPLDGRVFLDASTKSKFSPRREVPHLIHAGGLFLISCPHQPGWFFQQNIPLYPDNWPAPIDPHLIPQMIYQYLPDHELILKIRTNLKM